MYTSLPVRLAILVSIAGAFVMGWVASYFHNVLEPTSPVVLVACIVATVLFMWQADRLLD
jgi:uncharacterized membrane protein YeaQ/YmgE (transglycosylase-associated protein family)